MTYNEFIQNIIDTRGQWNIPEGEKFERHHIIPCCLGGEGDRITNKNKSRFSKRSHHPNCIWLKPAEHIEAHKLLAEENPENKSLLLAYQRLIRSYPEYVSDEEINKISKETSEYRSKLFSGKNNPNYGNHKKIDEETKLKISKSVKETFKDPKYHEIFATNKGKKFTLEHREKISKSLTGKPGLKGKDNPFYGKKHSPEALNKMISVHEIPVYDVLCNKKYESITKCALELNMKVTTLHKYIKNNKTFNGHKIIKIQGDSDKDE